ncbi:MAG: hypothetical protein ACRD3M_09185 [Thermoanaerobaculia bacterium]
MKHDRGLFLALLFLVPGIAAAVRDPSRLGLRTLSVRESRRNPGH